MPNKKKLYDALVKEGYNNFENEDAFNAYVESPENRKTLYNALVDEGFDNFEDESAFHSFLGYGDSDEPRTISGGVGTQEEADAIFEANAERFRNGHPIQRVTTQSVLDAQNKVPDSEIKRLKGIMGKAQQQIDEASFFDRFFDDETRTAVATRNKAEEALEMYDEANREKETWFDRNVVGALKGFADKVGDLSTWDFGASGVASAVALKDAVAKMEAGEKLSSAEQNLLDAYGLASAVQAAYQDKVGMAYNVGGSLPESMAFGASLALNPLGGAGKKIGEAAAKAAVKKYGTALASKLAKGAARVGGDVLEMGVATAVPGAGRVAEDYYNRLNGQATFDIDENGIVRYGGQVQQEEADNAIWKAMGSQFIENYSEAMGNYFAPMGQMLSNLTSKGLKAAHLGKFAEVLSDVSSSQFSKGLQRFKQATKFDGLVGEYLEEVAGNVMNAATVGDMNFNSPDDPRSVFNPETNIETFLSCALLSGTMYAVEAPVSMYNKNVAKKNLNKADTEAKRLWGDRWDDMRSQMDEADPQLLAQLLTGVQNATDLSDEQKQAAKDYGMRLMQYQGYNARRMQNVAESTSEANAINNAYDEGSELQTPADKHQAKIAVDRAEAALGEDAAFVQTVMNGAKTPVATINAMAEQGYSDEQIQKAKDYYSAMNRMNGMTDALLDEVDSQIESANVEVDMNTNKELNQVIKVVLRDGRQGYVVNGTVTANEEGVVDVNHSDSEIMVRFENGDTEMMNPNKDLQSVAWIDSPAKLKENNNTVLRQSLIDKGIQEIDWNPATPNPKVGDSFEMDGIAVTIVGHDGHGGMFVLPSEEWQAAQGSEQKQQAAIAKAQQMGVVQAGMFKQWASDQLDAQEEAQDMAQQEAETVTNSNELQPVAEGVASGEELSPVEEKRPMTEDEAASFIFQMERNAVEAPEIELTPENWIAEFGEDGLVETPIGQVKFGQSQYLKLQQQGRNGKLGMIRPTLTNPDIIIEDASKTKEGDTAERGTSYVFVKAFKGKDGKRVYYFTSITIKKDGLEVVVSNQEKRLKQIQDLMMRGKMLWNRFESDSDSSGENQAFSSATTENPNSGQPGSTAQSVVQSVSDAQIEESVPLNDSNKPTSTDNQSAWLGINSSELSTNKDSDKNVQSQENKAKPLHEREKEDVFRELGEMYGEKMPHKVEVTAKAWTDKVKKAQKKVDEAQRKLDDAPIGEDAKQKTDVEKAKAELESVKVVADFWAEMDADIKAAQAQREAILNPVAEVDSSAEPQSVDEFVAQQLASGNIILDKEDYKKETGYVDAEANAMNGGATKLFGENGMTIQEAGERLMEMDRENGTNFFDQSDPNAGRDALIELLGAVKTRKELNQYVAENRKMQAKKDAEGRRDEMEKAIWDSYHISLEEFVAQIEYDELNNPYEGVDFAAVDAIFAEAELEREQSLNEQEYESGRNVEGNQGQSELLSEAQSDNEGGSGASEGERTADEAGVESQNNGETSQGGTSGSEVRKPQIADVFAAAEKIDAEEKRRRPLRNRANEWAKALGVKVHFIERVEDVKSANVREALKNGNKVAGWYSQVTGEVFFLMPNLDNVDEIDNTYVHEVVAHKGMFDMLGKERYDALCDKVWEMMPKSEQKRFINYPGVNGNTRIAADEYIAHLSESLNLSPEQQGIWDKIVQFFRELFDQKLNGILSKSNITNDDIANLIRASYANLKSGAAESVVGEGNRFSAKKKRALETASVSRGKHQPTVVSSADGANILNNLDNLAKEYEEKSSQSKTFLGDVSKAIGTRKQGSGSQYATFETVNGNVVTIRLADHNATVSNFDNRDENEGISIVVSAKDNNGITNDGDAHIVEYFYDSIDLRRADGKPLAEIVKSIKQSLYSGEFKDTTGLAERQEVNPSRFRVINDKNGKKTLVGLHNISEAKLKKAIKQGGLANPSMAVIDMDKQSHVEYGDITLVAPESLVDKKLGRNVGTYMADAYTPIYPTVTKQMSNKGEKALTKSLKAVDEIFRNRIRLYFNNYLNSGTMYDALFYWYLSDIEKNPPILEAALPDGYTREEVKNVKAVNPDATIFAELSEEERRKVIDLYIEREGGKEKYEGDLANRVEGWKKSIEDENALQMRKKFSQDKLNELEEYGYEYDRIANYYKYAIRLANASSKPSEIETFRNAYDEVVKNGLEEDFGNWLMAKEEELGVEEKLFTGYDNQGRAKYVPNTLENASKLMKKEGRAGATGLGGFNYFVAILAPVAKNTKQISAKKQNLSTQEEYDRFAKKWGDHYHKLALQLQPGADKWADYGYHRLHEIAPMANPKEYVKKEYGIELSDKFIKDLNDVKNAIRNDFPARYFETKFERPVYLNEFAAAVVPQGTSKDVMDALSEAGLPIEEYERDNNEARMAAVDKVSSEIDGVRFRFIGERGARNLDKAEEATTRLDNLAVAREMEASEKDAKAIKMATGWERGADGLWRYEVDDVKVKDISETQRHLGNGEKLELKDVLTEDSYRNLITEYPKASKLKFYAEDFEGYGSGYYDGNNIVINKNYIWYNDFLVEIIIHELQHAIQSYEGFERGTSPEEMKDWYYEQNYNIKTASRIAIKRAYQIRKKADKLIKNGKYRYNAWAVRSAIGNWASKPGYEWGGPVETLARLYSVEELKTEYDSISEHNRLMGGLSLNDEEAESFYRRNSGEVEARNAERRKNMPSELRRKILASETEDVSREDQNFLKDGIESGETRFRSVNEPAVDYVSQAEDVVEVPRDEVIYTMNNIAPQLYKTSGRFMRQLYKYGTLGRVLKGEYAEIDQIKAKQEYDHAKPILEEYLNELVWMKYQATEAAQEVINDVISDVEYAMQYYKDLSLGKDVWRTNVSPRFRISGYGKHVKVEVDRVTSKYNGKEVMFFDSEMTDEEIGSIAPGYTAADLKPYFNEGTLGGYSSRLGKISIFADNNPVYDVEDTIFHENLHAFLSNNKDIVEAFADKALSRFPKNVKSLQEKGYSDEKLPEELLVRLTAKAMSYGIFDDVRYNLPEGEFEKLKEFLKHFGYDYREEVKSRSLEEGRRGTPTLLGGEEVFEARRVRQDSGRQKEERRARKEELGKLFDQVADMGLDGVLENRYYGKLLMDIYQEMPLDVRRYVSTSAINNYGGDFVPAMSDYLNVKATAEIWGKVVGFVRDVLRKVGFDLELNQADVKYMLWRSQKPMKKYSALDVAEDIDARRKFGVDGDSGVRFSVKNAAPFDPSDKRNEIVKEYDAFLKKGKFNFIEAFQDRMYSVKVFMDMIVGATGKKVRDFENAYEAENQLGSINKPAEEKYLKNFYKPIVETLNSLSSKYGRDAMERYIYCKSGLERNEVLRQRDADEAFNAAKEELDDKLAKGQLTQPQYDALLQQAEDQRQQTLSEDVDYSGIRGMWYNIKAQAINKEYEEGRIDKSTRDARLATLEANRKTVVQDWKQFAENEVAAIESRASSAELKDLWKKINAATNETLRMDYESGMIDKATYDAEKNMMKYYVPLRNWADTTAEEMYEYRSELVRPVSSNQKRAKGRESQADNPIATIALMAQNAIVRGNRNKVKQKLYAFVANRETGLASVRDVWYVKDPTTDTWEAKYADTTNANDAADFAQILDDFENDMQLLESQGLAYKGKLPLGMKFRASRQQKQSHVVPVMINGKEYAVYVNGNPRPAQAMNGETNSEAANASAWYDKIKRIYGAGLTSWNPDFIIPNMIRDGIHASTMTFLDAGPIAAARFALNGPRAFGQVFAMISGFGKGLVNPQNQAYFEEFVANGGETGYTAIHTLEDYKKEYDKLMNEVKGLKGNFLKNGFQGIAKFLEATNRIFEDVNRFNAYVSARESGESIMRSISAAKNITVNFNRKGALSANNTAFGTIANAMSKWILFFNPAVQGFAQLVTKTKVNPKRAAAMASSILASGIFMPMLNEMLVAANGGDDEDDYWNQSDFKRRNNWLLFTGDGYASVPLPPVLRELYGIGDIIYGSITGHITPQRAVMDMARQVQSAIGFVNLIPEVSQEPDMVTWAKGFAPDIAAPVLDVISNTNFMGRPIAKWTDFNEYDPEYERVYKGVSPQWVWLSKQLNKVGGDEGRRSDVWGNFINPAMMEHLFTSYGGGIGKTINNLAGMALDGFEGNTENLDPYRKSPIVPRFYIPNDEKTVVPAINRKYYDYDYMYNVAKKALKTYQDGVRSKEHPEWKKYIDEMQKNGELEFIRFFEHESKRLTKMQNLIKGNPTNKKELEEKMIDLKADIATKCYEMLK